ncbi:MAG: general secretion pathway protein GspK [Oligoflexia bacterium]|nr:general secretion pathway protein GspK [Oligoflexia bacterium]
MTRPLARAWQALTRPRSLANLTGRSGLRARPHGGERSGIALLVVMTTIMIITVIVSDLAYTARVRFLVTAHRTEHEQAYWLARSGVELYKLLILADKQIGSQATSLMAGTPMEGMALGGLLDMVPQINTGLLVMLMGSDSASTATEDLANSEDLSAEQKATIKGEASVSDEARQKAIEEGGGLFSERSWLDMPGDFSAQVEREDCRINVNLLASNTATTLDESPTYQLLVGLMSGEENEQWLQDRNLTARELVANLADWVDADALRSGDRGGYEDGLYQIIDPPYLAKNAAFDTQQEIRLVEGWQDEVFARFGDMFTVYGSGKLNITCDDDQVIWAILHSSFVDNPPRTDTQTQDIIDYLNEQRSLYGGCTKPADFIDCLKRAPNAPSPKDELKNLLTDQSSVYRITSTGLVGTSATTITEVLQYDSRGRSKLLYHHVD